MAEKKESRAQQRNFLRVSVPGSKLKIAFKNELFRGKNIAERIRIKDISIGGLGLIIPDAGNIVERGSVFEFVLLLPNGEICWLTGTATYVRDDICGVQLHEDASEQKKISQYVLQREREICGRMGWKEDPEVKNALGEKILDAIWKGGNTDGKRKILFVSAAGETPSILEEANEVKMVKAVGEGGMFSPDLVFVDSSNLTFSTYHELEELEKHPVIRKSPVFVFVAEDHGMNHITIRTSSGDNLSCSMPKGRYKTEMPHILNALLSRA